MLDLQDYMLDQRTSDDKAQYLVKWAGAPEDRATWDPAHNLPGWMPRLAERLEALPAQTTTGPDFPSTSQHLYAYPAPCSRCSQSAHPTITPCSVSSCFVLLHTWWFLPFLCVGHLCSSLCVMQRRASSAYAAVCAP